MLTTTCTSMGGVATPNYCPGADDIQCCTGYDAGTPPPPDGGTMPPPSGSDSGTTVQGQDSGASTAGNSDSGSGVKPGNGGTGSGSGSSSNGYGSGKPEPGDDAPTGTHGAKGCSSSPSSPQDGLWLAGLACLLLRRRRSAEALTPAVNPPR
jgi:MYXO-CTERM domain-containing protein